MQIRKSSSRRCHPTDLRNARGTMQTGKKRKFGEATDSLGQEGKAGMGSLPSFFVKDRKRKLHHRSALGRHRFATWGVWSKGREVTEGAQTA